jgi:LuxR family maltose regulon positive regulatory protein
MLALLEALARKEAAWSYPRRLLTAYDVSAAAPTNPALVEQLSARELDVLRLLASDLDGPSIARELVVSLNTVRTHTKSIYAKLGVNSRRAAVTRAGELHLLGRSSR